MDPSSEIVSVATTALAWSSMVTETGIEKSKVLDLGSDMIIPDGPLWAF